MRYTLQGSPNTWVPWCHGSVPGAWRGFVSWTRIHAVTMLLVRRAHVVGRWYARPFPRGRFMCGRRVTRRLSLGFEP